MKVGGELGAVTRLHCPQCPAEQGGAWGPVPSSPHPEPALPGGAKRVAPLPPAPPLPSRGRSCPSRGPVHPTTAEASAQLAFCAHLTPGSRMPQSPRAGADPASAKATVCLVTESGAAGPVQWCSVLCCRPRHQHPVSERGFESSWEAAAKAQGLAPLPPTWETRMELQAPGFGLDQSSCGGHLGRKPSGQLSLPAAPSAVFRIYRWAFGLVVRHTGDTRVPGLGPQLGSSSSFLLMHPGRPWSQRRKLSPPPAWGPWSHAQLLVPVEGPGVLPDSRRPCISE